MRIPRSPRSSRSSCTSRRAALATIALAATMATGASVRAAGDAATLAVRITPPPPVAFDATALGRATHPFRLVLTNPSTRKIELAPLVFRLRPMHDGVTFSCDEPQARDDRWPQTLDAGASLTVTRDVACDTPLPGRYDVEVRARPRGGSDSEERTYGSFSMQIEPGANPPVRLPWDASLLGAAAGTTDMRPTKDPNAARIVVGLINATRAPVVLSSAQASLRVTRRGSTLPPCVDRNVELPFTGPLAPGRMQTFATPLGCVLSADAVYDVDVFLSNGAGARVKLATHAIRVGVIPPPPARPENVQAGKVVGGM